MRLKMQVSSMFPGSNSGNRRMELSAFYWLERGCYENVTLIDFSGQTGGDGLAIPRSRCHS